MGRNLLRWSGGLPDETYQVQFRPRVRFEFSKSGVHPQPGRGSGQRHLSSDPHILCKVREAEAPEKSAGRRN